MIRFARVTLRGAAVASLAIAAAGHTAAPVPPPLEAYGELPTIEDIAISPSGKLAMLTTANGKRVLILLDQAFKPISVMEVGDIKIRTMSWIGDEALDVVRTDTQDLGERFIAKHHEFRNDMIVSADGSSKVETIFADDRHMLNAVGSSHGFRKVGGKWIGLFTGWPMAMGQAGNFYFDGGSTALYSVDIATNKDKRLTSAPVNGQDADWLVDAKGQVRATLTFTENSGDWKLEDDKGTELAAGTEPKGGATIVGFSPDGKGVIYLVEAKDEEETYYQVPLAGGAEPHKLFDGKDIDEVFYDSETERVIGYRPNDEASDDDPVFFGEKEQETVGKVMSAFNPLGGELRGYTPDFGKILIETSGNNDSGTWYLVDTRAGKSNVIGHSRPQIGPYQVGPVSTIAYKAQDGLEIEAILTLPPGREAKNLPLVMLPHGGPRANDYVHFDWWAQAFASRGYAVLQPNFRGSTGYGNDFMHKGDGEWGKKMQTDLSDGIDYLAKQGTIDPKRVCIVGGSYGGYAALAGVTLQKGIYRCAVADAAVSDPDLFFDQRYIESGQDRGVKETWLEMMGPRDQLDDISPRKHTAQADAPILLIHGKDDTVVPFDQSTKMADALKDAGKPYQIVELDGEDHWLSRSETRNKMLEAAVAFVEKYDPAE